MDIVSDTASDQDGQLASQLYHGFDVVGLREQIDQVYLLQTVASGNQHGQIAQYLFSLVEVFEVHECQTRFDARPQMTPHHRPGVRGHDVEAFLDQLGTE